MIWTLHAILLSLLFVTGTLVGSFANVCIYRLPWEKSVIWPPSCCPRCLAFIGAPRQHPDRRLFDAPGVVPIVRGVVLGSLCVDRTGRRPALRRALCRRRDRRAEDRLRGRAAVGPFAGRFPRRPRDAPGGRDFHRLRLSDHPGLGDRHRDDDRPGPRDDCPRDPDRTRRGRDRLGRAPGRGRRPVGGGGPDLRGPNPRLAPLPEGGDGPGGRDPGGDDRRLPGLAGHPLDALPGGDPGARPTGPCASP